MFRVDFENSYGKIRTIGNGSTKEDAFKVITSFLKDHNFKSYYMRCWEADERTLKVDAGSWSEYFYIVKED